MLEDPAYFSCPSPSLEGIEGKVFYLRKPNSMEAKTSLINMRRPVFDAPTWTLMVKVSGIGRRDINQLGTQG
ncbi:hypothetical protein [Streptomyces sp. 43Y-GA-1]|uniref:hypothetical protein n=1 Tax=Streptomyces sp. 43Y-GA-1 TaxID=2939435 RepID=UPI0020BE0802|nr:hypothetical protein [Streptomyces sp. 43Y-GA-1]MCL6293168.1 hypothetical protein [Streptomyces sp. 43Y-GA-1]